MYKKIIIYIIGISMNKSKTIVNSKILSMESEIGQIKKGFIADIVATKINPIDDITSLENVQFVMKEGKIYKN